jgi:homoserine dehydrogenase
MGKAEHQDLSTPSADPLKRAAGLVVLKFGSAMVGTGDYPHEAVHEAYRWVRAGKDVLIVVSAPAGETDTLFALAEQIGHGGRSEHLPRLLRIGELRAAAILALALERAGLKTAVLDPHEMDLRAEGDPHEAILTGCDTAAVRAVLDATHVVVVPGYCALGKDGGLALLGRGGADYTAAFLGRALGAERVRLIRPAADVAGDLTSSRGIRFAQAAGQALEIAAPARAFARDPAAPAQTPPRERPLKVALLGCGTVGGGVYAFLARHDDLFEVTKILVRSKDIGRYADIPERLLTWDPEDPDLARADVVAESIGGQKPAADLVIAALQRGQDVVTANKEIYARRFAELQAAAEAGGAELRVSACVGGGVPVIEAVDAAVEAGRTIVAIEGVANGTSNFVLDEMEAGLSLADAVKMAQEAGYAEADPSADIDGWDAAAKMAILARRGLGLELLPDMATKDSLRPVTQDDIGRLAASGQRLRQVGRVDRDGNFSVHVAPLPQDAFLAGARGPENRFRLVFADGQEVLLSGLGAGRWPTAEAMFADLLDLHRLRAQTGAA